MHRETPAGTDAKINSATIRTLDKIIFYGLLCVIFFSAIPYGTVDPFYKSLVIVSVCGFAAMRIIGSAIAGTFSFSEPGLLLPLVGILGLAIIQILPFPFIEGKPISWDTYETKVFIVTFAALLILAELLFSLTNSKQRLKALIAVVLITGTASALFGFLRALAPAEIATSIAPYLPAGTQGYAQFINRNHFEVLMEMALGLTVGLLLKGQVSNKSKLFGWLLTALFVYVMIAANSRGGLAGLAALSLFGGFIHIVTRRSPTRSGRPGKESGVGQGTVWGKLGLATAISCLIFGILVFTVAFVGGDASVTRIEKIENEVQLVNERQENRRAIWRSTVHLIRERPLLGFGFGAYGAAIPQFDEAGGKTRLEQAHNEYLEILANGGVVAFALFTVFTVIVIRRALDNFRSDECLVRSSCFGAMIGMVGVATHSLVDFGLHVMVNVMIFIVLIVIATVSIRHTKKSPVSEIW